MFYRFILYIFGVLFLLYVLFFFFTSMGVLKKKKNDEKSEKKNNFFGIVIAARNEDNVIENLITSLKKQNYPEDYFEIFVVPNNCTDNTSDVAKKAGASIIECKEKVKSKGDVLKYAFDKLSNDKRIDAYVIFDADNVVHSDFLMKMNDMINNGSSVIQGFRDTKNISDNWLSSSYAIMYYIQSLFFNESRYRLGKSSFLNGTGIVIKKHFIDKYGFSPKTLTEDIELTTLCALNGEKIDFAVEAITYDEQVNNFKTSIKQRKRWSFGTIECIKEYFPMLVKKAFRERSFECFDVILFYSATFIQILFGLFVIFALIFSINDGIFSNIILLVTIFYIGSVLFRIFIIKRNGKSIKDNIGGILFFDLFLISWLPVNFICLFMKQCDWEIIKHDRNIDIQESKY